jgi:uncharacterized membrane protein YwzB
MQCARAILSSVTCPALPYFSTLSQQWYDFLKKKKVTENKMCVLICFTSLSETFSILRRSERDMIKNVYWCSRKVTIILV